MRFLVWGLIFACGAQAVDFNKDIQPILTTRCSGCHGPQQQMKGLRVDQPDVLLNVVVPGNSGASKLIQRVSSTQKGFAMPPVGAPLTSAEIGLLRAWIDAGAKIPATAPHAANSKTSHWAFQPLRHPPVPEVSSSNWPRNPIDNFILARLQAEHIQPSPEADRNTLIRRLSLDLTGLPPTPEEAEAFLADKRPMPMSDWWIACSPRRITAKNGRVTGWIWRITPTATAMKKIWCAPGPGAIGNG